MDRLGDLLGVALSAAAKTRDEINKLSKNIILIVLNTARLITDSLINDHNTRCQYRLEILNIINVIKILMKRFIQSQKSQKTETKTNEAQRLSS